jgi:MFS family permease
MNYTRVIEVLRSQQFYLYVSYFSALVINLVSGTIYIYSSFGPQMAVAKNFTDYQMSIITSCGTYGLYIFGPIAGRITDTYGPRASCALGAVVSFFGYLLMSLTMGGQLGDAGNDHVVVAVFYMLVGIGCSLGYSAGLSTVVKNASAKKVGVFSGLGVGFFAISGLVFTSVKSAFFNQTEELNDFFLCLAVTISCVMICCLPFVKVMKGEVETEKTTLTKDTDIPIPQQEQAPQTPDIQGWDYIKHPRFWYLLLNMLVVTGSGMMYVMKVGTVIQALCDGDLKLQYNAAALNTAVLSACNFLGRLTAGLMTDFAVRKFGITRVYFMGIAAIVMAAGHAILISTDSLKLVLMSTVIISYTYGLTFAITSPLLSDWFSRSQYAMKW